jgi:hypothetical protein
MATIDNLNFKVILDDKDFTARMKADLKAAQELNTQLSNLLAVKQKYSQISASDVASAKRALAIQTAQAKAAAAQAPEQQKVQKAVEQTALAHQKVLTEQQRTAEAAAKTALAEQKVQNAAEKAKSALSGQGRMMRELAAMAGTYFSVMGVSRFLGSIVRVTGEFETQRLALRNILQDINGADALFDRLKALAIQSPFTFQELGSYAKQLSAFSIPLDELYDTTKMLADVSAGLGVDMGRLILAYGQVRSASFLRGTEVRQFTEAGVPLLTELAKQFEKLNGQATTAGDVFDKISKRLVPFEMVKQVMVDLTSEGGKFFEMQSVLSETLKGKVMKLEDAWEQMLASIGESNSGMLHGVMDTALDYVQNYEKLGSLLGGLVATWGVYKVAVIAAGMAQAKMNGEVTAGMAAMKGIGNFIKSNPWAVLAAAVTACAVGVYKLVTAENDLQKMQSAVNDAIGECVAQTESEMSKLSALRNVMERAGAGTEAYGAAKKALLKDFNAYLSDLDRENLRVGNLAAVYDSLAESVRNSTKERFYSKATEGLENEYKDATENIIKQVNKAMDVLGLDSGQRLQMTMYVSGQVDAGQLDNTLQDYIKRGESVMDLAGQGKWTTVLPAVAELVSLREEYARTRQTFDTETAKILATFGNLTKKTNQPQTLSLTQWQKDVNAVLEETYGNAAKNSEQYIKEGTVDFANYVDAIRKKYAELGASLANASTTGYEDESAAMWKDEMRGIEAVAQKLGKTLKEVKQAEEKATGTGLADTQKRERESIETQISQLQRLKKAYDDLASFLPESLVGEAMKSLFPDLDSSLKNADDYDAAIRKLAEDLKKIPGSERSADSILASLVGDVDEPLKKAVEAGDKFAAAIQERLTKAFDTEGTNVGYKVSEIFRKLREQNTKTDKEYGGLKTEYETAAADELALKAMRIKYGEEFWNKYLKGGISTLESLQAEEKEYYRKKAQEQINALSSAYVSAKVGEGKDIDVSNLSDKSLRQVTKIKEDVQGLLTGVDLNGLGLSDDTINSLGAAGLTLKDFYNAVKALLQGDIDKLSDEIKEKLFKAAQTAAKGVSSLGQSIAQLGEAIEDANISDLGTMLEGVGDAVANIASGISSGNIGGAAMAAATELLNGLTEALVNEATEAREAEQNATDYANAVAMLKLELSDIYDTVWGTDTFGKLGDAFTKSAAAAKAYSEALAELNEKYDDQSYDFYGAGESSGNTLSTIFGTASRNAYDLNDALEGLQRMQVLTNDRNWFQQWLGFADEYTALGNLAPDLWEGGDFNVDNAKKFLDTNTQISDAQREEIQNLINLKEQYDEIQNSIDDMVESIVGSLASDVVDSFLESFKGAGDAVADLDDAFANLGETIVSALMQSTLIDTILNKYTPKIQGLVEAYSEGGTSAIDMVSQVAEIADGIKGDIVNSSDVWNDLLTALQDKGLLNTTESSSSSSGSLSEGIKSVTEDTASLLASYVNAIRADVSTGREQRAEILEVLRTALTTAPSLGEYLMQIQANTYNTAIATQEFLAEFRGVLAPHSEGGNGVKVVAE